MKKFIYTLAFVLIVISTMNIKNCFGQWQTDVRLTNNPAYKELSLNNAWSIASNGSVVHIVWHDERDGYYNIYYKRSTDGGISWGADTRMTYITADLWPASIAVSGSVVHLVWSDKRNGGYEIYYKRSTDAGVSWGVDTRITNTSNDNISYPSIAVSGSVVHIVWHDERDGNPEIYYKNSVDAGVSWGADLRLTNNPSNSNIASISVSGSAVHVVWFDERDGNKEIYYKRSTDGGVSWGADTRLTSNDASSFHPSVAVSGSAVHVVWFDERDGNYEIYYKRSTDGGVSWGLDTRLTYNTADSELPSLAVSGIVVHVVWHDKRDGYNWELYYKRSTNAGISWETDTRLTNNLYGNSLLPSVSVSGTVVHVVWSDQRDGQKEIYYKLNPTGNPIGIQNISTEIPSKYSLNQNYPNPFNPTSVIRFSLSVVGNTSLRVYDINGREVQTLVNERLQPGTYETTFDGSNLSSGMYFYKLSSGNYTQTKKLTLIK